MDESEKKDFHGGWERLSSRFNAHCPELIRQQVGAVLGLQSGFFGGGHALPVGLKIAQLSGFHAQIQAEALAPQPACFIRGDRLINLVN